MNLEIGFNMITTVVMICLYYKLWKTNQENIKEMKKSTQQMIESVKLQRDALIAYAIFEMNSGGNAAAEKSNALQKNFSKLWKLADNEVKE